MDLSYEIQVGDVLFSYLNDWVDNVLLTVLGNTEAALGLWGENEFNLEMMSLRYL